MKLITLTLFVICLLGNACGANSPQISNNSENVQPLGGKAANLEDGSGNSTSNTISNPGSSESPEAQTNQPKTVRDFFNLLPQKYFLLEGCEPAKDKNCKKARAEYLKTFLEIEDTGNGYLKGGCDGAQSCLTMALFKRQDLTYIVAVHTINESEETNYFLEYKVGKWTDISARVIPRFSTKNIYELPQKGTTIQVFKKNFPEPTYSERGEKIYELSWDAGKFSVRK